jgi:hypothetical protein
MESLMRHLLLAGAAALSALTLSGCMTDDLYGPPVGYADIDYGGYYDGYYGPFLGGYWGPSGLFYYPDHRTGRFHPDTGHHFRRDARPGFNPIHGHAPPAAGHGQQGGSEHRRGPGPHP